MGNSYLEINNISKSFGNQLVLNNISFDVSKGEFVTILGSSGSGKSTLIRLISGLESPDSGSIILDGKDITNLPPEKRGINMVFQSYALFPHMSVKDNVSYSLKLKRVPKIIINKKVNEVLNMVSLIEHKDKFPHMLSGGEKQRVAIARAIINEPMILLLDEPLSALDRNLRLKMQEELKSLQKNLGITFIYITHDQEEAMYLSDRIAILDKGDFVAYDTPEKIANSDIPFIKEFISIKERIER